MTPEVTKTARASEETRAERLSDDDPVTRKVSRHELRERGLEYANTLLKLPGLTDEDRAALVRDYMHVRFETAQRWISIARRESSHDHRPGAGAPMAMLSTHLARRGQPNFPDARRHREDPDLSPRATPRPKKAREVMRHHRRT